MKFKNYNQNQEQLLPPSYKECLGESHEAIILDEFVNELNTSDLEKSYKNTQGGSSAYHPVMILKTLIYSYMNGVFSSRKISKKLHEDIAYMYLSGNNQPDFRTMNRFRKEKGEYLEKIFQQVVNKAHNLGIIKFGTCSLDGSKFYANASRANNYSPNQLEKEIKRLMDEADKIDDLEDKKFGDEVDGINPELRTKEGRDKRKKELEKQKKNIEKKLEIVNIELKKDENIRTPRKKVNTTDVDSKMMQMKKKDFANGYNVQNITENGIILTSTISNRSSDQKTLIETVEKLLIEQNCNPQKLLADKGYSSEENYEYCERKEIDSYIPIHRQQVILDDYQYNKNKNSYTDKDGRVFKFKQFYKKREKGVLKRGRPKKNENIKKQNDKYKSIIYMHIDQKTQKPKYLQISAQWQRYAKEQKEKLSTFAGKQIYKIRMHDVEGVFGNIKKNLNFTGFNLRGFTGITAEWMLVCLAHNIKKLT